MYVILVCSSRARGLRQLAPVGAGTPIHISPGTWKPDASGARATRQAAACSVAMIMLINTSKIEYERGAGGEGATKTRARKFRRVFWRNVAVRDDGLPIFAQ